MVVRSKTDEVAEWLRRWTANPLGYARVGSNPILVEKTILQCMPLRKLGECYIFPLMVGFAVVYSIGECQFKKFTLVK